MNNLFNKKNMNTLVIFDSNYGNTQKIAEVVAQEISAKVINVSDLKSSDLLGIELLVVGSPIIGWRPAEKMGKFLDGLAKDSLKGIKAGAFDTRMNVWYSGNAYNKIAKKLKNAGAEIIVESKGFYVKGKEGPLVEGELEKAKEWARTMK